MGKSGDKVGRSSPQNVYFVILLDTSTEPRSTTYMVRWSAHDAGNTENAVMMYRSGEGRLAAGCSRYSGNEEMS